MPVGEKEGKYAQSISSKYIGWIDDSDYAAG
jgi:hypothetical protein